MEPVIMIVGGLWLWNKLKGSPLQAASESIVPGSDPAIAAIVTGDQGAPTSPDDASIEAIINAKIASCGPVPGWQATGLPGAIAPHGALIPGVDFDVLTPVPAGLPGDAHLLKPLATYANGTSQDLWESPTRGRFIVTTTPQGGVTVVPDLPMSFSGA